jgi:hypothetical protein
LSEVSRANKRGANAAIGGDDKHNKKKRSTRRRENETGQDAVIPQYSTTRAAEKGRSREGCPWPAREMERWRWREEGFGFLAGTRRVWAWLVGVHA